MLASGWNKKNYLEDWNSRQLAAGNFDNSLAVDLARLGKPREAIEHYRETIAIWSEYAEACKDLGNVLFAMAVEPTRSSSIERPLNCDRTGMRR